MQLSSDHIHVVIATNRICEHTHGVVLARVNSIRDLGVTHNSRLNFQSHIVAAFMSAVRKMGFIIISAFQDGSNVV